MSFFFTEHFFKFVHKLCNDKVCCFQKAKHVHFVLLFLCDHLDKIFGVVMKLMALKKANLHFKWLFVPSVWAYSKF